MRILYLQIEFTLVDGAQNPTRPGYGMIVGHWGSAGWGASLGNTSASYRPNPALGGGCDALPAAAAAGGGDRGGVRRLVGASVASAEAACTAAKPPFSCGGFVLNGTTATLCQPGTFQPVAGNRLHVSFLTSVSLSTY